MIYLIGSILLTSYLTLSFKVTRQYNISNLQVLFFISVTSALTGILAGGSLSFLPTITKEGWFPWSILTGLLFITLFLLIAFVTQNTGVSVAASANRLSLIIPFVFSVFYYKEAASIGKWSGIVIILTAVWMICRPLSNSSTSLQKNHRSSFLLPGLIFLGSGMRDTMVNYAQQEYLNPETQLPFLIISFASAIVFGALFLVVRLLMNKEKFKRKSVVAGIIIGIPAYFSFWCMVNFLRQYEDESSTVIPINNLGIVLLSTAAGTFLFKEKLSVVNQVGIGLSIAGILLLAFY